MVLLALGAQHFAFALSSLFAFSSGLSALGSLPSSQLQALWALSSGLSAPALSSQRAQLSVLMSSQLSLKNLTPVYKRLA